MRVKTGSIIETIDKIDLKFIEDAPTNIIHIEYTLTDGNDGNFEFTLYKEVPESKQIIFRDNILNALMQNQYFDFDTLKKPNMFKQMMGD